MAKDKVPTGRLKQLNIADIKWDKRYREEFGDLEGLSESIKVKGVLQPITVGSDMTLLAGERRIRAAILAGLDKIPALVRDFEDEVDMREIELMENLFRKDFTWPEECALIQEIDRLYKERNIDWSGRKTAELLNKSKSNVARALQLAKAVTVIPELGEMKTADDALKAIKKMEEKAVVAELRRRQSNEKQDRGMLDMLKVADANYRIGDTLEELVELKSDGFIHFIECDPPYGIELNKVKSSKDSVDSTVHGYNEVDAKEYPKFLEKLAFELYRVAGKNCWLAFWYGPTWHTEVKAALKKAGWQVDDIPAIWAKKQGQTLQPEKYLARGYEPFFVCRKGEPALMKRGRLNIFEFSQSSKNKYHPTERPIELMEELISTFVPPMSVVLVPFLGSGVTLRACYNLGMKCWGWDKSDQYKDKFMLAVEEDTKLLDAMGGDEDEESDEDDNMLDDNFLDPQ